MSGLPTSGVDSLSKPMRRLAPAATTIAAKSGRCTIQERSSCTAALKVFPSARPAALAVAIFMTAPICRFEVALASAMASRANAMTSSGDKLLGRYAESDRDLRPFASRKLGAAAPFESLDRILPLFDLLANHRSSFSVVQHRLGTSFFNGGIFHRRFEHAQGVESKRVSGPHGRLNIIVNLKLESHQENQ